MFQYTDIDMNFILDCKRCLSRLSSLVQLSNTRLYQLTGFGNLIYADLESPIAIIPGLLASRLFDAQLAVESSLFVAFAAFSDSA
jgi:hypothetical protein